jgi:hypothetical protein
MMNDLGFKVVTLFTSAIKINARDVEDALQLRFQGLPLGCRLWRTSPDTRGAKFEEPDGKILLYTRLALFILTILCH